jgi:hypothetical protein
MTVTCDYTVLASSCGCRCFAVVAYSLFAPN